MLFRANQQQQLTKSFSNSSTNKKNYQPNHIDPTCQHTQQKKQQRKVNVLPSIPNCQHISDLQSDIMKIVVGIQTKDIIVTKNGNQQSTVTLSFDLQNLLERLQGQAQLGQGDQSLKVRIHQLAISKILVFVHGKSDFRLVKAHFQIGRAYRAVGCLQQAINHLTIAHTKLGKQNQVKDSKVYNSYILTELSYCYFLQGNYDYAYELVTRAGEIQNSGISPRTIYQSKQTLEISTLCLLRFNKPKEAAVAAQKLTQNIQTQLKDFQQLQQRLSAIVDTVHKAEAGSQAGMPQSQKTTQYRRSDTHQCLTVIETIREKTGCLLVDYKQDSLRATLDAIGDMQPLSHGQELSSVLYQVQTIIQELIALLQCENIFRFKVYSHCNELMADQRGQLAQFLEREAEKLTSLQHLKYVQILLFYARNMEDVITQKNCLEQMERILQNEESAFDTQVRLLQIKKQLALLLGQMSCPQTEIRLEQIKLIQHQLFGRQSQAMHKTLKMKRIAQNDQKIGRNSTIISRNSHQ